MQAKAQFVRRLSDGTINFNLRLEGAELDQPIHVRGSAWRGDIFLVEKVEPAPPTVKFPAIRLNTASFN